MILIFDHDKRRKKRVQIQSDANETTANSPPTTVVEINKFYSLRLLSPDRLTAA